MGIPILMYHALDDRRSAISVAPATFERQMRTLYEECFQVMSLSRLVHCLRAGEDLPQRSVVITFDDGLESVYSDAFPTLERFGFPATVFLVAGFCARSNDWPGQPSNILPSATMTWAQVRELDRRGIEFGAHTFSHPRLDRVARGDLEHEILESKAEIEQKLGHSVDLFSYPYGRISAASAELVGQAYAGACTTGLRTVAPRSDPLALDRVDAYYVQHPQMFRLLRSPLFSLYLAVRRPARAAASAMFKREWE